VDVCGCGWVCLCCVQLTCRREDGTDYRLWLTQLREHKKSIVEVNYVAIGKTL